MSNDETKVTNETADSARGGDTAASTPKGLPPRLAALMDQIFGPQDQRSAAQILADLRTACGTQGHETFMETVYGALKVADHRDLTERAQIATGLIALAGDPTSGTHDTRTLYALVDAGNILLGGCVRDVQNIMVRTAATAIAILHRHEDERLARMFEGAGVGQG